MMGLCFLVILGFSQVSFFIFFSLMINGRMGELMVEKHVKYILSIEKVGPYIPTSLNSFSDYINCLRR